MVPVGLELTTTQQGCLEFLLLPATSQELGLCHLLGTNQSRPEATGHGAGVSGQV